jgi:putative ATP-binding cassette transporter
MTTSSRPFLRDASRILLPYWWSEDRRAALGLLAAIVFLNLGSVYVLVLLNAWNRVFYDALQQRDFAAFAHELGHFCWLAALFIVTAVYRQYLTQTLEMRWRRWLTDEFLGRWLGDRAYYHFERIYRGADNPDQRIAEDLQLITSGSLSLASGLLNAAVTLCSFIGILWSLSEPLTVTFGGSSLAIPAFLVWAAILYAVGGSIVTHRIGRPLVGLSARQQRAEADFRFGLVRLRENSEEVALYGGEALEQRSLGERFNAILDNWRRVLLAQKRLGWFTAGYGQAATVFPIVVAAPRYFSGAIQLGTLMQIASAFGRVQDALSWFVDSYGSLAEWKASMERVRVFARGMTDAADPGRSNDLRVIAHGASEIVLDHVEIALPSGAPLIRDLFLVVRRGEHVLLGGPSGSGKSTIFRTIAGLWPYGRGKIARPASERILFLPQRSYLPIATLREAVAYPADPQELGDGAIMVALRRCKLERLIPRLGETQHWEQQLSPGEQQLLALARVFLQAPAWLFLDEATSALDEATERHIYRELRTQLPGTTIVSIAHRPGVAVYHERRVELVPVGDAMRARELPPVESAA